ncbi:MAG TPA: reverse transcriptase domain-containing protein [Actinomycetota bacterium]|nr:reverse transcriptase domain-containing protein [Actinomycetota bacterium]
MQSAATLLGVIQDRGSRGLPLERVYRHLFNRELYLQAFARISGNEGSLTPGVTAETADGMSLAKIDAIIEAVRFERYRWTPARRIYIEKKHSTNKRPLGIPVWSDKLLQEVLRMVLEAYFEPQFSPCSHGFRQGRGCHTALQEIKRTWMGTTWFVEGDIAACFDSLDHSVMLSILGDKIHDGRFLRLMKGLLEAGYLEEWTFNATPSGTPQGGVVSPILSNIYLDALDKFVETTLLQAHNRGTRRKSNRFYARTQGRARYLASTGRAEEARALRRQAQAMPSVVLNDPDFRRLRYLRYADDFLLGFVGPRREAEEIKRQLGEFLHEQLKLDLSEAKTLITHGRTQTARFLGYEVTVLQADQKHDRRGRRSINGQIGLKVPAVVVRAKCASYCRHGRATPRRERINESVYDIVVRYQSEYRGLVEYYRLAYNLHQLNRLKAVMQESLAKTLAAKLQISVAKVYRRFGSTQQTARGPRRVFKVTVEREGKRPLVAHWGAIPLVRRMDVPLPVPHQPVRRQKATLALRLLANTCELCRSHEEVQVHLEHRLKDLQRVDAAGTSWAATMVKRHRKSLMVCESCHQQIHVGRPRPVFRTCAL